MVEFALITHSAEGTIRVGRILGLLLQAGDVVGLMGELGSGKTWFTKGIALGLGVAPETVVTSPSFALVNQYTARVTLYHMDVYRLETMGEFVAAGLEDYLHAEGVAVMEWADLRPEVLPAHALLVRFVILAEPLREITFSGTHPRAVEMIEAYRKRADVKALAQSREDTTR